MHGYTKISVVIPTHNNDETLARTIDSVIYQTEKPFDIIVINDASATGKIYEIVSRYSGIKLLERGVPGPGGYAARNLGIKEAAGDWIAFLDADDTWEPEFLTQVKKIILESPDAAFICSGWYNLMNDGRKEIDEYSKYIGVDTSIHIFDEKQYFSQWVKNGSLVWTSAVCVRKSVIQEVGGFPEGRCRRGGDIDTWTRIILSGVPLHRSCLPLATYFRETTGSVTKQSISQMKTCTDSTIRNFIEKNHDVSWIKELKKFSNVMKHNGFKQYARYSRISWKDLKLLYWSVEPLFFLLCFLMVIFPSPMVRWCIQKLKPLNDIEGR